MALELIHTKSDTTVGNYWKIRIFTVDLITKNMQIALSLYKNDDSRRNAEPMDNIFLVLPYEVHQVSPEDRIPFRDIISKIYKHIKTLEISHNGAKIDFRKSMDV